MTAAARLRRPELRRRRQAEHVAAAAGRATGPNARVMTEVDHLRMVINQLPADQADRLADQAVAALAAITSTHPARRRSRRQR